MVKLQTTLQQVYAHIAATAIPHIDEPCVFNVLAVYTSWTVQTNIHIYDRKGSRPAAACRVSRVKVCSVQLAWDVVYITLYTLTQDTLHASARRDHFGSYIYTDVCLCSPGSTYKLLWMLNR